MTRVFAVEIRQTGKNGHGYTLWNVFGSADEAVEYVELLGVHMKGRKARISEFKVQQPKSGYCVVNVLQDEVPLKGKPRG